MAEKKRDRAETEACILALLYVIGFDVSCYLHSVVAFVIMTLYLVTLLACSWRIERLERRIAYYRRELSRQIREELEAEEAEEEEHKPHITVSKGA